MQIQVSDMGLEEQCSNEDMQISRADIPIVREHPLDVKDDNSLEDSRVIKIGNTEPASQLPRTIYAPIGDAEFWLKVHIGLVEYALRTAKNSILAQKIAEARVELVQNDLYRQYSDKTRLEEELKKEKIRSENYKFGIQLALLLADNKVEEKEKIIKMYEERFGTREELLKLAQAEENCLLEGRSCKTKYNCISKFIESHKTGKCPKTIGQRAADFVEKLLNPKTYLGMATAFYTAFRGKTADDDNCG
ncbi:MAG: hypothetical protein QW165_01840 [Candidatus Woesearchaeota archaeon]